MSLIRSKLIGNRAFYKMVLAIVIPIIVQNAITNFVSLLDNLMVGRIGTEQMSGVAVANQLMFVFNLTIFGAISGAGIFTAQYHGAGNIEGVRASCRYKLYFCLFLAAAAIVLFLSAGPQLISMYLTDTSDPVRAQKTLDFGLEYLHVMLLGLFPFAISQCYAGTLRETGKTTLPMVAGIIAVLVNLLFNYLLIFGKGGFEPMHVKGAAYATVLSRYVELAIILIATHTRPREHAFAKGLYRTLRIPGKIVREITAKGLPLLANELLWSLGVATLSQIYSIRGMDVIAANNISSTITNLFNVVFLSMGSASAIIVGQSLGANDVKRAKDDTWKLMFFSLLLSLGVCVVLSAVSHLIPRLYNTTEDIKLLAGRFILISALIMPVLSIANCSYFVLRSGGKTGITFLFDCGFSWIVVVPLAYCLAHFTNMPIAPLFLCVQLTEFIKIVIGILLIRSGIWVQNIVSGDSMKAV